ncbi:MAG: hypothetical protein GX604_06530 [Actinobacteria bacterium]|nr:hypothetical protein [Actinomycetota bacterium]
MVTQTIKIKATAEDTVSGVINVPEECRPGVTPGLILAHGQSNDMNLPLLAFVAEYLADSGVASVLRFNFPYAERGAKRPDTAVALQTAFQRAHDVFLENPACPSGPVFLGGKSLGARIASELVSRTPEAGGLDATGLVFLGFPLHAPGRGDQPSLEPLRRINVPSLFITGTRDPFCDLNLLQAAAAGLDYPGTVYLIANGNHSFEVPAAAGRSQEDVNREIAERVACFIHLVRTEVIP